MKPKLSRDEITCVKRLAKLFEKGEDPICDDFHGHPNGLSHPLELRPDNRDSILTVMEQMEIITEVAHSAERRFSLFRIDRKVLQVARDITEQESKEDEPRDIVEHIKTTARRNPFWAWAIIVFLVLTLLMNFLNNLFQLLDRIKTVR